MKNQLLALTLTLGVFTGISANAQSFLGYKCGNLDREDGGSFQVMNSGNSRNGASASIKILKEPYHLTGVWLWTKSFDKGTLGAQSQYTDQGKAVLTIVEQKVVGKGEFISASIVTNAGKQVLYTCIPTR